MPSFSRDPLRPRWPGGTWIFMVAILLYCTLHAQSESAPAAPSAPVAKTPSTRRYFIREYRVKGAKHLPVVDIESAVYPFLGPGRTEKDIEHARAALEKTYQEKGYQTVAVQIPQQEVKAGVIYLQVIERPVGRLRVVGAKYFSPDKIKAAAPSLAPGTVIDFNQVPKDVLALNQNADRQVTPSLKAGISPETVDVDLEVKDKDPIHANLELNNRYNGGTHPLRVNGGISDSNLFQLGHTLGFNFQVSPQDLNQVKVFSGYYLAKFPSIENFSLLLQGTIQDSDISTLGGSAVSGRGDTAGMRGIFNLPAHDGFTDSISAGIDYKRNLQRIRLPGTTSADGTVTPPSDILAPVTYFPISANYTADWISPKSSTEANVGVTFHLRGMGSDQQDLDNRRYKATGNFIYLRADLARTQEVPAGLQIYGKVQGQISNEPLLDPEEFTAGGLGTVRGYLEGEAAGDDGAAGSLELRSPNLFPVLSLKNRGDWRGYVFTDGAWVSVLDALNGQKDHFYLASYGVGTRAKWGDHLSGSVDLGHALLKQSATAAGDWRLTFRAALDF